MNYTWLIFDADNTLYDFSAAQRNALVDLFDYLQVPFDTEYYQTYQIINDQVWDAYEKGNMTSSELSVRRYKMFFDKLSIDFPAEQASEKYLEFLSHGRFLMDGAAEIIPLLAERLKLLLLTNGLRRVQRPRFEQSELMPHFHDFVISDEVGYTKPDPEIFSIAFERMGNPPKEDVLLIGDKLSSDIRGGNDFGIDTCWYNPNGEVANNGVLPKFEIRHLKDLPALIGVKDA